MDETARINTENALERPATHWLFVSGVVVLPCTPSWRVEPAVFEWAKSALISWTECWVCYFRIKGGRRCDLMFMLARGVFLLKEINPNQLKDACQKMIDERV